MQLLPSSATENGAVASRFHDRFSLMISPRDELGFKAVENPVHVRDLHATILHLLGFDHERFTVRYAGRDFRLTDIGGRVVSGILHS